ncbi:MAG: RNA-binding cell elongation regulator Jag/EloR [Desulfomicrobium sp.]|nr:RNA-binding cell elongation regulator Jag/EloR [Desulfomicrobium sp.]
MSAMKEFRAKTVDQAIENACQFFAVDRDSLEIDIVSGGSTGIFGLGAKKATIKAKKRHRIQTPASQADPKPVHPKKDNADHQKTKPIPHNLDANLDLDEETPADNKVILAPENQKELEEQIQKTLITLLLPISSDPHLTIDTNAEPITVHIDDDTNSGLIIGRDGQTIAALQYLLNRIISKQYSSNVHIQLDAGDYRQKQQEQLQETALFLSDKAKKSGKVQSTRPLSPFHRRLVHMALQNDHGVQTRSKGEGPMKRVLILPTKRNKASSRPAQGQDVAT